MTVSLLSENLLPKISFLNHAVSLRSTLPILSNFLIEAKKGKLVISATDLEIGISATVAASVEEEGRTTVPAKNFSDLITNIRSQKITLTFSENVLKLKGEKVKASFQTVPPDEFPKLFELKGEEFMTLDKKEVGKFFQRVSFAAASDSTRPSLLGILFEKHKEGVVLVATDQYRLSYQKTSLKTIDGLEQPIVVPSRLIRELAFLKEEDGKISFFISKENNQALIEQGETIIVGRLIDAEYPDYKKIIPVDSSTTIEIDREDLLNAIKVCSVFARETANIVKFTIEKDKLIVSANSPQVGEDLAEVDAKVKGEENEIAFNAKYLIDILNALEEEDITFEMTGPLNPGVFKVKGDNTFLHLIMPIRVQA